MLNQEIIIESDIEAVQIPSGNKLSLPEGSRIYLTQMRGNTLTAATDIGLVHITKQEARRVGVLPPEEEQETVASDLPLEEQVSNAMREVYDPEMPVNVVELGLIYNLELIELPEQGTHVNVKMTLTSPTCGMGPFIMSEVEANIAAIEGVCAVDVEFVWDPPWNQNMITEEGKMQLGLI